ncbi:MAG: aminoglycoside phosphotransferase family protein [Pseudobdellovibrio sp.]
MNYHSDTNQLLSVEAETFLKQYFDHSSFKVYQLAGDASARKYYRVIHNETTYVLMSWEPFNEENYPFISVLNHFHLHNVHVPEIKKIGATNGLLLLEDLGDLTLERKFWESSQQESSWDFYKKSLDEIIKIHTVATDSTHKTTAKEIMFDVAKFSWEFNYAREHLIEGVLKLSLSELQKSELNKIFTDISEKLHKQPKVICHRDYHSRNLMIKLDQVYVIDFQDARLGPIQYDLVSLLKDSYVDINDQYADKMLKYYLNQTQFLQKQKITVDEFNEVYELQSIQRCFKACGSFASFMNMRGDKRYLKYLSPTLKRVAKSLNHFSEYKLLMDVLIDSGAFEKNYERL